MNATRTISSNRVSPSDSTDRESARDLDTFALTSPLVALLRNGDVRWARPGGGMGAPAVNLFYSIPKVAQEILDTLGPEVVGGDTLDEQHERALTLHRQTEAALQVVLSSGSFNPGIYSQVEGRWCKVEDLPVEIPSWFHPGARAATNDALLVRRESVWEVVDGEMMETSPTLTDEQVAALPRLRRVV